MTANTVDALARYDIRCGIPTGNITKHYYPHVTYLLNIEERLIKYSDRTGECWLWASTLDVNGYGLLWDNRRKNNSRAHRLAWEVWRGPVANDVDVHHKCKVRACINPDHLQPIDPWDHNSRHHLKTECVNGHIYTPENTRMRDGAHGRQKVCITCAQAASRRWYSKNREAINARKRAKRREASSAD